MKQSLYNFPINNVLTLEEYVSQFWHFAQSSNVCRKIERRQEFSQPESESWQSLKNGDVLLSVKQTYESLDQDIAEAKSWPFLAKRVRVVEKPYTLYLKWELMRLNLWHEVGEQVVIINATEVRHLEPVPEIVCLDDIHIYKVNYSDSGIAEGAVYGGEIDFIKQFCNYFDQLYDKGDMLPEWIRNNPDADLKQLI